MRKSLRYLRIAFSATCLIACVLLIALWVRSYWRYDQVSGPLTNPSLLVLRSSAGDLTIRAAGDPYTRQSLGSDWLIKSGSQGINSQFWTDFARTLVYFHRISNNGIVLPHWFPIVGFTVLAVAPWIKCSRRFSLRTLLIATTLVAAMLGLIAWAARQ
jgi:hypothetical protein